ncbi:hypothetical protein [Streptomyces venezuelae]|nr:hypothetical protein [Streptomyces venezuelae]
MFAALSFGLPPLFFGDPFLDLGELVAEEAFDDAEFLQAGRRRWVGHVFESTGVGQVCHPAPMAESRIPPADRLMLGLSLLASAVGIAFVVIGVTMFWGPLREVLLAPVAICVGAVVYFLSRALWWTLRGFPPQAES